MFYSVLFSLGTERVGPSPLTTGLFRIRPVVGQSKVEEVEKMTSGMDT